MTAARIPIHLLMPMSGQGTRFRAKGYTMPKPLIPVSGTPMVERLLASFPESWPARFVIAQNHVGTGLEELLRSLRPGGTISRIAPHTLGPGHALLSALDSVPDEAPVLVSYCDYGMVWDPAHFERFVRDSDCDACVVSYRGFHPHYLKPQMYAYSRLEGERVVEVREKGCFTSDRENEFASCGAYYFKSARLLRSTLEHQAASGLAMNGELYTSLTVETLLRSDPDADVRVFEIPYFFQWGTPEDLSDFEYWENCFRTYNRETPSERAVDQILMPMAGHGSRFREITDTPKPLIPVAGEPMFMRALGSLPSSETVAIVALKSMAAAIQAEGSSFSIRVLDDTPAGQALSTEAGLDLLSPSKEVLVSACDHGIVIRDEDWRAFRELKDCDAVIFTTRGYPGAKRTPNSYSYVAVESEHGTPFPRVSSVSLKAPVSDRVEDDPLLTGTFWFRTATILAEGIRALKETHSGPKELYLDQVFDCLRAQGRTVRIFPLAGYVCWGIPEALRESMYWQACFTGKDSASRPKYPGIFGR